MANDKTPIEIADADLDVNGAGPIDALRVINKLNGPVPQLATVEPNGAFATMAPKAVALPTDILAKVNGWNAT